jgi:hypothetical protein
MYLDTLHASAQNELHQQTVYIKHEVASMCMLKHLFTMFILLISLSCSLDITADKREGKQINCLYENKNFEASYALCQ